MTSLKCSICRRPISKEIDTDIIKNFLVEFEITCKECVDSIIETNLNIDDDILTLRGM